MWCDKGCSASWSERLVVSIWVRSDNVASNRRNSRARSDRSSLARKAASQNRLAGFRSSFKSHFGTASRSRRLKWRWELRDDLGRQARTVRLQLRDRVLQRPFVANLATEVPNSQVSLTRRADKRTRPNWNPPACAGIDQQQVGRGCGRRSRERPAERRRRDHNRYQPSDSCSHNGTSSVTPRPQQTRVRARLSHFRPSLKQRLVFVNRRFSRAEVPDPGEVMMLPPLEVSVPT